MAVTDLLVEHFPKIMDLKFTARMEDELDEIATAKEDMIKVLNDFYHPFQDDLKAASSRMQRVKIMTTEVCPECGSPMEEKYSRTGAVPGCSKYPECKATQSIDGQPRSAAVETEHRCPKCGKPLMLRESKIGKFLSCSGYPACKEKFNLDEEGNPVPSVIETEHVCEKCGKPMALRQGSRGAFLGCTGYPKCRNTMPVDDQGKPVAPVKVEVKCEKCGGPMGIKEGRRGKFLGCLNYPKCRSTAPLPDDLKEQLGDSATARRRARPDLKAIAVDETCEHCGGTMIVRRGRRGLLPRLRQLPQVQGDRASRVEASMEKIAAATGGVV